MRLIDADAYEYPGDLNDEPTIDAIPVEIIKHYKEMWESRAQSGHSSDRIANGMMAHAAEIMLNYHEMSKSFYGGNKEDT